MDLCGRFRHAATSMHTTQNPSSPELEKSSALESKVRSGCSRLATGDIARGKPQWTTLCLSSAQSPGEQGTYQLSKK